ncbi:MAG: hypothetical protein CFE22_02580 [Cytophagaceae bacterium BCCC1]|nr:MAG: hypothetical protein CFE22_02580 [Cytophagaceae bacterium BCCC1]
MLLPKKIDDGLKDAIVSLKFISNLPKGTELGVFYLKFKDFLKPVNISNPTFVPGSNLIIEKQANSFLSQDENFRIEFNSSEIIFNIQKIYKGWEEFFEFIKAVVIKLFDDGIISGVYRIGLRYISQFENISIFDNVNAKISLDLVHGDVRGQSRFELSKDDFFIILSMSNRQVVPQDYSKAEFVSIIDVDVIKDFSTIEPSKNIVLVKVEDAHRIEKEIFFTLLKKDFLETLNPEY